MKIKATKVKAKRACDICQEPAEKFFKQNDLKVCRHCASMQMITVGLTEIHSVLKEILQETKRKIIV